MLADLVGWYTGRDENRRRYPRVKFEFEAEYSLGGNHWLPLHGIDLSGGGFCGVSEHPIPNVNLEVRMNLGGRSMTLHVRPVWNAPTSSRGRVFHTYGMQFVSVEAEDWEAIIRWITGGDDPEKAEGLAAIHMSDADVLHLIPAELRKHLLDELVTLSRYDPKGSLPVQYDYAGVNHHDGHAMHKLILHSGLKSDSKLMRFSTQFLISESGEITVRA